MSGFEALSSHPARKASAPSHVFATPSTSLGGGISDLLAREAAAPANCWTFNAKGLHEGITLDLQHPNVNCAALIMNEGIWVLRDKRHQMGALYRRATNGRFGLMRRASLTEILPQNSGKPFTVFSKLEGSAPYSIVHVDCNLPGVKPKIELLAGVIGNSVMSANWTEGLYCLSERSPIIAFRKDGSVMEINYNGGKKPMVVSCDREAALFYRLDYIKSMLEQAARINDRNVMARREDYLCYNLVGMLEVLQHVRNADERNDLQSKIVDLLVDLNDEGMLRKGVRIKLSGVLERCSDLVRWRYNSWGNLGGEDRPMTAEQQRKRQERLAKRTENLQRRAAANRSHQKGPSPQADKQGRKGKGKK